MKVTVFICGDSTAASYTPERYPLTGWGQVIGDLLPGVAIDNHAMPGRSTKSFIYEGRLLAVEEKLQRGDLVLIQFTHNDENPLAWRYCEPYTAFSSHLGIFVETARLHGAIPVLLTPLCMRVFIGGVLQPTHADYPDAIRTLAWQKQVPLIDVYQAGFAELARLGEEESKAMHIHVGPGKYEVYPDGAADNAHTSPLGARFYAKVVADGLKRLGLVKSAGGGA